MATATMYLNTAYGQAVVHVWEHYDGTTGTDHASARATATSAAFVGSMKVYAAYEGFAAVSSSHRAKHRQSREQMRASAVSRAVAAMVVR